MVTVMNVSANYVINQINKNMLGIFGFRLLRNIAQVWGRRRVIVEFLNTTVPCSHASYLMHLLLSTTFQTLLLFSPCEYPYIKLTELVIKAELLTAIPATTGRKQYLTKTH